MIAFARPPRGDQHVGGHSRCRSLFGASERSLAARAMATIDPELLPIAKRTAFWNAARDLGASIESAGHVSRAVGEMVASRRTWEGYRADG